MFRNNVEVENCTSHEIKRRISTTCTIFAVFALSVLSRFLQRIWLCVLCRRLLTSPLDLAQTKIVLIIKTLFVSSN